MKKYFMVSVNDNIYSQKLDLFLQDNLKMELGSTGCGTTEFISKTKPKNFKDRIIKNFGKVTYKEIQFGYMVEDE